MKIVPLKKPNPRSKIAGYLQLTKGLMHWGNNGVLPWGGFMNVELGALTRLPLRRVGIWLPPIRRELAKLILKARITIFWTI